MNLRMDSLLGRFYYFMFGKLPNDFCTLFWNTLISVIVFPIVIITKPFEEIWNSSLSLRVVLGILFWMLAILFSAMGLSMLKVLGWKNVMNLSLLLAIPLGLSFVAVAAIIILGILGGIGAIVSSIGDWFQNRKYYRMVNRIQKPQEPSKLVTIWATIKGKYCTKIDWK